MKSSVLPSMFTALLAFAVVADRSALGADSAELAALVKEKIQSLRSESAQTRNQITLTLEELNRLTVAGVDLRPQLDKYTAQLAKMDDRARSARARADNMREKGETFFAEWEQQVRSIQNEDIRKEAASRLNKRKKSYSKILAAMQDAKEELVPFMSDLNDIKKLLDAELTKASVDKTKKLIRQANWHGDDVRDSLTDVEKELDRVSAELAKYQ